MARQRRSNLGTRILVGLVVVVALATPAAYYSVHEEPLDVTATTVERQRVEQTITAIASGTVMAKQDSRIAAAYMGTVAEVHVEVGDAVNKGDLLVELGHGDLDAQVTLAKANVNAARSMLEKAKLAAGVNREINTTRVVQAEAQLRSAEQDLKRATELLKQEAMPQSQFQQLRLAVDVARENFAAAKASEGEHQIRLEEIKSAKANVEQLEAALEVAEAMREKAFVRAPFDGVVGQLFLDIGESVSPGMPVLQLVNKANLYVEAPFDESNASLVKPGQPARIGIDAYRDQEFEGVVAHVSPVVAVRPDMSRVLMVRVNIEEDVEKFVVGMSADITVISDVHDSVIACPSEALVREEYAYVIENGRAVRRDIEVGIGNWYSREIVSGLSEGDTLITSIGLRELADGRRVNVVEALE